jgi:outer membrane immunogenic protein
MFIELSMKRHSSSGCLGSRSPDTLPRQIERRALFLPKLCRRVAQSGLLLPAVAAGAVASFVAPAGAQEFTGPRLELSAGYDSLGGDGSYEDFPDMLEGAHVRAAIGYDAPIAPRVVAGIEASIGMTHDADATVQPGEDSFTFRPGRDIDVLARLGYQVGSRTLLYVKAGWANASLELVQRELVGNGQHEVTKTSADEDGVRLGAGAEHRITDSLYAKVEYRYTSFGDGYAYQPGTERNQLLLGAGLRF